MTNNEIKFLEYLDKAVQWEKEKQLELKKASKPFNKAEILDIVEDFEIKKIKTMADCVERMKMIKVSNNAFVRREFLSIIREDFNNVNFQKLLTNPIYLKIKNEILKYNPDLTFVDDDRFLHQIGNAFAHGNYNSLLDMNKLENLWLGGDNKEVTFNKAQNLNLYMQYGSEIYEDNPELNKEANLIRKKVHSALNQQQKVSDLRWFIYFLNNTANSDTIVETLNFKYESNRMLDADGNIVMRPATKIFNLQITHCQLKDLILVLLASREFSGHIQMDLKSNEHNISIIPEGVSNEEIAKKFLLTYDFKLVNVKNGTQQELVLDDKQKTIFINEYVDSREWFNKDFFEALKDEQSKDLCATNQFSHVIVLNNFFFKNYLNIATTDMAIESTENLFSLVDYNFMTGKAKNYSEVIADLSKYIHDIKYSFNTYTESLVNEVLLILQLIEDNQLFATCESNSDIANIVNGLNQTEILKLRTSPKYKNDIHSILYHLRDSFTHLMYLNNLNKELFIYDYTSKKNKTPDFKFTISIENLEKIKNELLSVVKTHYSAKAQNNVADLESSEDITL